MAQIEVIMPQMGESIMEATIIQWSKKVGEYIELDETLLEIATDKVDSEIPSPVSGILLKTLYSEEEIVEIGATIAIVETDKEASLITTKEETATSEKVELIPEIPQNKAEKVRKDNQSNRFYSPLVRSIAEKENIDFQTLDTIEGTGKDKRVTKTDILAYIENKETGSINTVPALSTSPPITPSKKVAQSLDGDHQIIEMDRMRRQIAEHMVRSKQTAPHVTSFIEVDVTDIVVWRNKIKYIFEEKYNEKITYTPIFIEAIVKAIHDFPMINVSVDGDKILVKKDINIGMATALPTGNLIVPVIKNADFLNLVGLVQQVNSLADKARSKKLEVSDIQGGTFTMTNVGTFGNVMGTPIINQPQVAILSVGAIRKKPAVLETEYGDVIAVRHMMFLSLSYDHRVVDGMFGGSFLKRVGDYLEGFEGKGIV